MSERAPYELQRLSQPRFRLRLGRLALGLVVVLAAALPGCSSGGGSTAVDSGPAALLHPIIFVSQVPSDAGEFQISDVHGSFLGDNPPRDQPVGGNLFRIDPGSTTPVNLTKQIDAAVRNPELSWNGRRVVFSMKQGARGNWQIWEIRVDGNGLRRVTNTPYNETEPVYLPDGRIVFASDRLGMLDGYENFPTGQLHVMDPDGTNVELLTVDPGGDVTPDITEDGEIVFTRWHAVIKNPCRAQAEPIRFSDLDASRFLLWAMRPDGDSDAHPIYGAHIIEDFRGGVMQTRPLRDGTGRMLATLATAETWGAGALAIIDPAEDIHQNGAPMPDWITPPGDYLETEDRPPSGGRYRDPYPRRAGGYIVSFGFGDVINGSFGDNPEPPPNFGIYLLDEAGEKRRLVYDDPSLWEIEPIEVSPRPVPPILPPTLDRSEPTGILNTMDVTLRATLPGHAPNPDPQGPIDPDEAAWVYLFRGVPSQYVYPAFHGYRQIQPAFLGRAPVLEDGSFAARLPADVPILWTLTDAAGETLVDERFWNAVRPGQTITCAGCHSPHDGTVGRTTNFALASPTDLTRIDPTRLIPGAPAAVASRAEWMTDQPRELDAFGIPVPELFAVDGESRSDHDDIVGQATLEVGLCLNVDDPRLFGPPAATLTDVAEVRLISPSALSPASPREGAEAQALVAAIATLGPTVTEAGTVLSQGSPITAEACTSLLSFVVDADTSRALQIVAVDSEGVETTCTLVLRCESPTAPPKPGREREDPSYNEDAAYDVQGGCNFGDDAYVQVIEGAEIRRVGGRYEGDGGIDMRRVPGDEELCAAFWQLEQVRALGDCAECVEAYEFLRLDVEYEIDEGGACAQYGPPFLGDAEGSTLRLGWDDEDILYLDNGSGWEIVGEVFREGPYLAMEWFHAGGEDE